MSSIVILPAVQMDLSSAAGKALRALTFQHVPKPALSQQVFQRPGDREKVQVVFAQIGDPKIPVLGELTFQFASVLQKPGYTWV